jgi:hypothetical protein
MPVMRTGRENKFAKGQSLVAACHYAKKTYCFLMLPKTRSVSAISEHLSQDALFSEGTQTS